MECGAHSPVLLDDDSATKVCRNCGVVLEENTLQSDRLEWAPENYVSFSKEEREFKKTAKLALPQINAIFERLAVLFSSHVTDGAYAGLRDIDAAAVIETLRKCGSIPNCGEVKLRYVVACGFYVVLRTELVPLLPEEMCEAANLENYTKFSSMLFFIQSRLGITLPILKISSLLDRYYHMSGCVQFNGFTKLKESCSLLSQYLEKTGELDGKHLRPYAISIISLLVRTLKNSDQTDMFRGKPVPQLGEILMDLCKCPPSQRLVQTVRSSIIKKLIEFMRSLKLGNEKTHDEFVLKNMSMVLLRLRIWKMSVDTQ